MDDLISRQTAIDAMDDFILDETTNMLGDSVREILEGLPSAQPEIVRCKDCKLFGDPKCLMCLDVYDRAEPDGYCHMAERWEK